MLAERAAEHAAHGYTMWWWRERATGELVATVGLGRAKVEGEPAVEVGWSVSPPHQRRGFATEAAAASIRWGFEVCGLERIVSFTMLENTASLATMEALGMSYEREFDREGLPHRLYAVTTGSPRHGLIRPL